MKEIIEALSLAIALFFTITIVIHIIAYVSHIVLIAVTNKGSATVDLNKETVVAVVMWALFYYLR